MLFTFIYLTFVISKLGRTTLSSYYHIFCLPLSRQHEMRASLYPRRLSTHSLLPCRGRHDLSPRVTRPTTWQEKRDPAACSCRVFLPFSTPKSLAHAASQWWGHRGLHQCRAEVLRVRITTRAQLLFRTRSRMDASLPILAHSATRSIRHRDPFEPCLSATPTVSNSTRALTWSLATNETSSCSVFYETLWVIKGAARDYAAGLWVLSES